MPSRIEEEYEKYTQDNSWKLIYIHLRNYATQVHTHSAQVARLPENRDRNRYRDVSPYDDYRIKLENCDNNYINASLVKVPDAEREYILTQGPLAHTSGHFWLMVWEQNCKGVLMLNKVIEDGRMKCHKYFPAGTVYGDEDFIDFDDVDIRVEFVSREDFGYFIQRNLRLVQLQTGQTRSVIQFHYVAWPDFGIPRNSESFLSFLSAVRQSGVIPSATDLASKQQGPPVIHCSAGIGRSGTFCVVDSALVLVEKHRSLAGLNIQKMLIDMRKYRPGLIQTHEQLQFSYMAILDGATPFLRFTPEGSEGEAEELAEDQACSSVPEPDHPPPPKPGPPPPERSSSLKRRADGGDSEVAPTLKHVNGKLEDEGATSSLVEEDITGKLLTVDVPEPPKRTASLHKAASIDQPPPPVPPRPPPSVERQVSAPPSTVNPQVAPDSEDEGYSNMPNKLKLKRQQERENKKRKLQEKVDDMRTKQIEAEKAKEHGFVISWSWRGLLMAGAVVAGVIAVGFMLHQQH